MATARVSEISGLREALAIAGMVSSSAAIAVATAIHGEVPLPIAAAIGLGVATLMVASHVLLVRPRRPRRVSRDRDLSRSVPELNLPAATQSAPRELKSASLPQRPAVSPEPQMPAVPQDALREAQITQSVEALRSAATSLAAPSVPPALMPLPVDLPLPATYSQAATEAGTLVDIAEAIQSQRLETAVAAIPSLADGQAQHHEIIVRLKTRTGEMIVPEGLQTVAQTTLLPLLEALKVARAIRLAGALLGEGLGGALFSSHTADVLLNDRAMQSFIDPLSSENDAGLAARHVVLSFAQGETRRFSELHWSRLADLADLGCRFAIEDVADLHSDFELLQNVGFMFVKVDAAVMRQGLTGPRGTVPGEQVPRVVHQLGLTLIVGRIDSATDINGLTGLGVPFGQGELFRAQERIALVAEPAGVKAA